MHGDNELLISFCRLGFLFGQEMVLSETLRAITQDRYLVVLVEPMRLSTLLLEIVMLIYEDYCIA